MKRLLLPLLFLLTAITACRRLPDVQGNGSAFLQGIWSQDSVANADKLLSFTKHKFKFTCDSFYVDLSTYAKVNYYAESCYNNGIWKEYAKGVYEVRNDTLFLLGTWTKADYKQKISGCYNIGQYIKSFKIKSSVPGHLLMESTDNQSELALVLKQQITCKPKSL